MWRITKKFSESLPLARRKNPGETLLEVLVALAILALVMVGVIAAITNAAKSNVNIENRIVALRLAEQGVEIVRNMRDTNYLRFSGNRRNKWLCLNSACGEKISGENSYTIDITSTPPKLTGGNSELTNSANRVLVSGKVFYRQIKLSVESVPNCGQGSATADCADKLLRVISRVGWEEGNGQTPSLAVETVLYDFFGRTSYKTAS